MIELSYSFPKSITSNALVPIDLNAPVTFLEWFNQKAFSNFDINQLFSLYREYIVEWGKSKKISKLEENNLVRDSYVQVLRDIVINFSTEEEKRFVLNIDFSDPYDIDVVLPFFLKKIKSICLFYAEERENIKSASIQHNLRGSNYGLENLIKKTIFDAAKTTQIDFAPDPCKFPSVSALALELSVSVEELYDTHDQYYNINPNTTNNFRPTTSFGASLSSANLNKVDYNLYLNFKAAIIDAIRQYPAFIDSLGTNNFTINPILSGTELKYLKNRDFITYLSGGEDNLKLNLIKRLAPKYLGNDFYYLSTGSTSYDFISGVLFSVKSLSGTPTLNLFNRQFPTTATVPSLESLYTEYELGRFFLPQHLGVLIFNTPEKAPVVDYNSLKPNTIYAFPDPNILGNTSYNADADNNFAPIVYEIDVTWNKFNQSNQFVFGDVLSDSYHQLYYGYQSQQQDLQVDISGISKAVDNVQFWGGEKQAIWANPDIWPDLKTVETLDYESRQSSLLANNKTPTNWFCDKFGNQYSLLKTIRPLINETSDNFSSGFIAGSRTRALTANSFESPSLYDTKNNTSGALFFRNVTTNTVLPASASLSGIYLRYPDIVKTELFDSTVYFALYHDVIVLETSNYIVVDGIDYDFKTAKIKPVLNAGSYFRKSDLNNKIQLFVNEWYSEYDGNLYLCFIDMLPQLSASNYKVIYPKIYRINTTSLKVDIVYPAPTEDLSTLYSLSAGFIDPPQIDIKDIQGASFSYFHKNNTFNLTYLGKNLNKIPFIYNEQFIGSDPFFTTLKPKLFRPLYFVYDNNYANPVMPHLVKAAAPTTIATGSHNTKENTLHIGQELYGKTIYYFHNGLQPLQINYTGKYIIQFDWESYDLTTLFLGCSAYSIKNVENNIVWSYNTSNAQVLSTYGQTITAAYFDVQYGNSIYQTKVIAKRVTYPDPSILELTITSVSGFSGMFCPAPASIYRDLSIVKAGSGTGIVFSDPFCLNCGDLCEEKFATDTTLTLIGSAAYASVFSKWEGGSCDGNPDPDCIFNITDTQTITAYFDLLPLYRVMIYTNGGRIISVDTYLDTLTSKQAHYYLLNEVVSLSCQDPLSGYIFRGYKNTPCEGTLDSICSFYVTDHFTISAFYTRIYDYGLDMYIFPDPKYGFVRSNTLYSAPGNVPTAIFCPVSTCSTALTGTPSAMDGGSFVSLTATANRGYRFIKWEGIPIPVENITNNTCEFNMGDTYNAKAVFDLGDFTFTIVFSGDGIGTAYSTGLADNFTYTVGTSGEIANFDILNGSLFTINVEALTGSTLLGLYNNIWCDGPGVSSCNVILDNDVTVIAYITAGEFVTLQIVKTGTMCGGVSSNDGRIVYGPKNTATYPKNATVYLTASATAPCIFEKIYGEGVQYLYGAGPGIIFRTITTSTPVTATQTTIPYQEYFGLETESGLSINLPGLGAPYKESTGLLMTNFNNNISVVLTVSRTISAEYS